jgi:hypothetical protein
MVLGYQAGTKVSDGGPVDSESDRRTPPKACLQLLAHCLLCITNCATIPCKTSREPVTCAARPVLTVRHHCEFAILEWSYADEPFYESDKLLRR